MTAAPIAWGFAADRIMDRCADDAVLARVLAALGLVREFVCRRGAVAHWPPAYVAFRPWRRVMAGSDAIAARGLRAGEWTEAAIADHDRRDALRRQEIADRNRALRDAEVWVLWPGTPAERAERRAARLAGLSDHAVALRNWKRLPPDARGPEPVRPEPAHPPGAVFLEYATLAWCDATGGAMGQGPADLAAFAWNCGRGRATARLARLVGVDLVSEPEMQRRLMAEDRRSAA